MEGTNKNKDEETKMLGGLVPESVYWRFKSIATARKESMAEAILNAALLYIDFKPNDHDKSSEEKRESV